MKNSSTPRIAGKKLAAYSSLAGSFLLLHSAAQGQINYTDLDPDESVFPLGAFDVDMDDNGDVDFTFSVTTFTLPDFFYTVTNHSVYFDGLFNVMKIYPAAGNGAVAYPLSTSSGGTLAYAEALNAGSEIDGGAAIYTNSNIYMGAFLSVANYPAPGSNYQFYSFGAWPGKTEKYVGVKFAGDGGDYYGWVRCSVNNADIEVMLLDYAYNGTPDAVIEAGEMPSAINSLNPDAMDVYSNGNIIYINDIQIQSAATVQVYDVQGKQVFNGNLNINGMQIALDNASTGVYTVRVATADDAHYVKQVFVKN